MTRSTDNEKPTPMSLIVGPYRVHELKHEAMSLVSVSLEDRQICELELLLSGAYHPLRGFMNKADYDSVLRQERLYDGTLWPVPVVLDLEQSITKDLVQGQRIVLRDDEGAMLAILTVGDIWQPDLQLESKTLGNSPGRSYLIDNGAVIKHSITYVGGTLEGISLPVHFAFPDLRKTPQQLKSELALSKRTYTMAIDPGIDRNANGFDRVIKAAITMDAQLVLHPAIGAPRPTDLVRIRQIKMFLEMTSISKRENIVFSLLPLMAMAQGNRELLRRAIVHRNYGANHLVFNPAALGFDASPNDITTIHELDTSCRVELGISLMPIGELPEDYSMSDFPDLNDQAGREEPDL
ncbi:MAG: hypothetical protein MI754_09765, partial [Chromatiales bacterium]|nr:hypothetical protein [Chromatiales bacterium]